MDWGAFPTSEGDAADCLSRISFSRFSSFMSPTLPRRALPGREGRADDAWPGAESERSTSPVSGSQATHGEWLIRILQQTCTTEIPRGGEVRNHSSSIQIICVFLGGVYDSLDGQPVAVENVPRGAKEKVRFILDLPHDEKA